MTNHTQSSPYRSYSCMKYCNGMAVSGERSISEEIEWHLIVNGIYRHRMTSSPHELDILAVGHCLNQGIIFPGQAVQVKWNCRTVHLTVQGEKIHAAAPKPLIRISADTLCSYGNLLDTLSAAHHVAHGVHEGALVCSGDVLAYAEDVSRYNVLERLAGTIFLRALDVSQAVLVFSGRVPKGVAETACRLGVQCIASRALATSAGIEIARRLGLTLVCALRTDSFLVFSHEERIIW